MSLRASIAGLGLFLCLAPCAVAADALTFQLGWLPGGERAPVYLALQRGMFAAENLDVKIIPGRGSTDVLTKLATHVADLGEVGFDAYISAKANGAVPATAVMPYYVKQPDSLLTTTGSGINSLKDVAGKSIAATPFGTSILAWPFLLKLNGVDADSVRLIKADASAIGAMLASGRVDAIFIWGPSVPALEPMLITAGKQMKLIPWSRFGYEGYSQTIMASDKTIAERPEVVRRFLKVFRQAVQLTHDDPAAAAQAVKTTVPQVDLAVVRAQVDATIPLLINEISQRDGLGVFNPQLLRKSWEWVANAYGLPVDKIDPLTTVNTQLSGS